jgi:MFS family permease
LFILLILNYLDRNALASARVQGIEKDLGMKGNDFNVAISILFAGYILGQVPSNLILSRVRPSIYLSGFVALWGAVSACTAAADNFTHLVVIRFFLGVTESPYFPGAIFLLSAWYTKKELAVSLFVAASAVSVAKADLVVQLRTSIVSLESHVENKFRVDRVRALADNISSTLGHFYRAPSQA